MRRSSYLGAEPDGVVLADCPCGSGGRAMLPISDVPRPGIPIVVTPPSRIRNVIDGLHSYVPRPGIPVILKTI